MKKFILPLLLLLAIGMLAAVESDPSAVVGYVKYQCLSGDNVIAVPMQSDYQFASELGDAIGAGNLGYFDSTSKEWVLIDKQPWEGGGWTDDFNTTIGMPLWTYVDEDGTWPPVVAKNIKHTKTQIRSK